METINTVDLSRFDFEALSISDNDIVAVFKHDSDENKVVAVKYNKKTKVPLFSTKKNIVVDSIHATRALQNFIDKVVERVDP